jgi:hypothetical protein
MTQISRPFQIVLAAFALFVAVWFVALRAHNSSTSGGSGSSASASSASQPARPAVSTAARAKALGAAHHVSTSSAHATSATHTTSATVTVKHSVSTSAGHTTVVHTTTVKHTSAVRHAPIKTKSVTGTPSMQVAVEHELRQGKTVLILFWNPHGSDDVAVHKELPAVQRSFGGKVAVHYASASQVGSFGTITHAIQVTGTPTLLIVNRHGQTTVLTGLTDAFSIEQTVDESKA